jgi:hypothetical protein
MQINLSVKKNLGDHSIKNWKPRNVIIARIHSQFESLGFVGKYDQSPTNIVNS